MSREKLIAEIEKCEIVCANCHALRTYAALLERRHRSTPEEWTPGKSPYLERKRADWRASAAMLDKLCDVPCADCGRRFPPCVMQFDHRDPAAKKFVISRSRTRAHATLLAEVAKCDSFALTATAIAHTNGGWRRDAGVAPFGRALPSDSSRAFESRLPLRSSKTNLRSLKAASSRSRRRSRSRSSRSAPIARDRGSRLLHSHDDLPLGVPAPVTPRD